MSEFVPVVPQAVEHREGVPAYTKAEFAEKKSRYCLLIPVINEGERILAELDRAAAAGVTRLCDVALCDGGSTDGSMDQAGLTRRGVNTLLVKPARAGRAPSCAWALPGRWSGATREC